MNKLASLVALAVLCVSANAGAQAKCSKDSDCKGGLKCQDGACSIPEIVIVGRIQKPIASVDVNKIQVKLTLSELKQSFLDRIEDAAKKDPF